MLICSPLHNAAYQQLIEKQWQTLLQLLHYLKQLLHHYTQLVHRVGIKGINGAQINCLPQPSAEIFRCCACYNVPGQQKLAIRIQTILGSEKFRRLHRRNALIYIPVVHPERYYFLTNNSHKTAYDGTGHAAHGTHVTFCSNTNRQTFIAAQHRFNQA